MDPDAINQLQSSNHVSMTHLTMKGTMGASKLKKRVGLFGIFSSNKVCIFVLLFVMGCYYG